MARRGGMLKMDTVWRTLGRAAALRGARGDIPLVVLTSHLPKQPSEGDTALRAAGRDTLFDVVELLQPGARKRLGVYADGGCTSKALRGFWPD